MDELIQKFMELLTAVPIIPILIAFSLLRRFISKPNPSSTNTAPSQHQAPDDGYGRPQTSTFDAPVANPEFRNPSTDSTPADSLYGNQYGTTKFGFDESEWGSTFDENAEPDPRSR